MANGPYILRVDCPDKPGIVAGVAGALRDHGGNIEDASQFNDKLTDRFYMRVVFSLPAAKLADFKAGFKKLAGEFGMAWEVRPQEERTRVLIMVSKEDHCLNDLLYRWRTGHLSVDITAVISNHPDCKTLVESHGLRFEHLPVNGKNKVLQEEQVADIVEETGTELIVLARYMQILSPTLCKKYPGRIINIHHSFLPGFKGAKPYHQAHERGVKLIGATAHFVTEDLDEGPIIEQETARVSHSWEPARMQRAGRDIEAAVLARALEYYAERRIFLHGRRTIIL